MQRAGGADALVVAQVADDARVREGLCATQVRLDDLADASFDGVPVFAGDLGVGRGAAVADVAPVSGVELEDEVGGPVDRLVGDGVGLGEAEVVAAVGDPGDLHWGGVFLDASPSGRNGDARRARAGRRVASLATFAIPLRPSRPQSLAEGRPQHPRQLPRPVHQHIEARQARLLGDFGAGGRYLLGLQTFVVEGNSGHGLAA